MSKIYIKKLKNLDEETLILWIYEGEASLIPGEKCIYVIPPIKLPENQENAIKARAAFSEINSEIELGANDLFLWYDEQAGKKTLFYSFTATGESFAVDQIDGNSLKLGLLVDGGGLIIVGTVDIMIGTDFVKQESGYTIIS